MKRILVTGASGQIGAELVLALRALPEVEQIVAAGHSRPLPPEIGESGPTTQVDVTVSQDIRRAIKDFEIDTLYHMGSILSARAEQEPQLAFQINIEGLWNVLETSRVLGLERVIIPSSIAAFGPEAPRDRTPNETIQRPTTIYGISKVFGELMGNYYAEKMGLDVRGIRLPGVISWRVEPTAGTTDYAVAAFYGAVREKRYTCYLKPGTYLPMMYMRDAIRALIEVGQADIKNLRHHADFNVNAMSFAPEELAAAIRIRIPEFRMDYQVDPLRQSIADSWPNSLDDSAAREEWGWEPQFDLSAMTDDMLVNLVRALGPAT